MKKLICIHFITAMISYSYGVVPSLQTLVKRSILQQVKEFPGFTPSEKEIFNLRIQKQYDLQNPSQFIVPDILDFKSENFKYLNLSGIRLWDASLESCNFEGSNLQNADLQGCVLKNAYFNNANLREAGLIGVDLRECCFRGASLQKVWLTDTLQLPDYQFPADIIKFYVSLPKSEDKKVLNELIGTGSFDLRLQHLEGLDLTGVNFKNCDLTCAYLQKANLTDVQIENTTLRGAKLSHAILSKDFKLPYEASALDLIRLYAKEATTQNQKELLNKILGSGFVRIGGAIQPYSWTRRFYEVGIDDINLMHFNLQGINLSRSVIAKVKLQGTDLRGANLTNATFNDSQLQGALLPNGFKVPNYQRHDKLIKLYSDSQDCKEKENLNQLFNIMRLDLYSADLSNLKLAGINLRKASLDFVSFKNTDLTKAVIKSNSKEVDFSNATLPNGFKVPIYQDHSDLIKLYSDSQGSKEKENLNQLFDHLNIVYEFLDSSTLNLLGIDINSRINFQNTNLTNARLKIYVSVPETSIRGALLSDDFKAPDYQELADLIKMYSNSQDPKEKENLNKLFAVFKLNLREANLSGLNLAKINLTEFNLEDANLSGTDLTDAILEGTNLNGANLSGTKLSRDFILPLDMSPQKAVELYASPKTTQKQKDLLNKILAQSALHQVKLKNLNVRGIDITKFDMQSYLNLLHKSFKSLVDIRKAHIGYGVTIPEYQDPIDILDFKKEMYDDRFLNWIY